MKRFFFIFALLFASVSIKADERSEKLITAVKAKINSVSSYSVNFESEGFKGILTVSGYRFALVAPELEVYYDGATLWNYDINKKEVNVEDLDPNDPNVMVNPSKLLDVSERDFSHRSLSSNIVELTPRSSSTIYSSIILTVNATTSLPDRVEITDRETGEKTVIRVSGFKPNVSVSNSTFKFDIKKYRNIDVVDFRN